MSDGHRDLEWLHDSLRAIDRVFFGDELERMGVQIKWMRWRLTKTSFCFGDWLEPHIRISPVLAHDWVPDEVVLATIYHEALHARLGDDHDSRFSLAERVFPHHAYSEVWCSENYDRLIAAKPPLRLSRSAVRS